MDLHSNAEVSRGAAVDRREAGSPVSTSDWPSCSGLCGRLPTRVSGSEKGVGVLVRQLAGKQGPSFACERPRDGRCLGLVNVGFLRGSLASHGPLVALPCKRAATSGSSLSGEGGIPLSPRRSGQGERAMSATRGARRRSGLGRSLRGEQSTRGAPRNGVSLPLTWSPFGDCPSIEATRSDRAVAPNAKPAIGDVRVVQRRARGDIGSAETAGAHAASRTLTRVNGPAV
jgi:hypothetical protein